MKLFTLLLAIPFVCSFSSCEGNRYGNSYQQEYDNEYSEEEEEKTPEQLREELRSREEEAPLDFITCEQLTLDPQQIKTRNGGLFRDAEYASDGAIIRGEITNSATLARFKDPRITLYFYSQTNTLIDEQSYVVYEYLEPQSTTSFSFKIDEYPDAYDHFKFKIYDASVAGV